REPVTDTDIYIVVSFFKTYPSDIRNAASKYKGIRIAYLGYRYFSVLIYDGFTTAIERYRAFVCSNKQVPVGRTGILVARNHKQQRYRHQCSDHLHCFHNVSFYYTLEKARVMPK